MQEYNEKQIQKRKGPYRAYDHDSAIPVSEKQHCNDHKSAVETKNPIKLIPITYNTAKKYTAIAYCMPVVLKLSARFNWIVFFNTPKK
jgi:hypothetical protein